MNKRVSVVILTFNEERHISRCIESLRPFSDEIFIVDSFSTDRTIEIAQSLGAQIFTNAWINYATQFNWALDNLPISGDWVMRMDADEYVMEELAHEIDYHLPSLDSSITGVYVTRRVYFMGKWIRHGSYYPISLLRIWRRGVGRCEQRWMDEHIFLQSGKTVSLKGDIVDENLHGISSWTAKHNGYATREAIDLLSIRYGFSNRESIDVGIAKHQASQKRWIKEKVYSKLPLGIRALMYFLYRYILRGGFLDGYRGTIFHILQGFWYRLLVDVKVFEMETKMQAEGLDLKALLIRDYGVDIS